MEGSGVEWTFDQDGGGGSGTDDSSELGAWLMDEHEQDGEEQEAEPWDMAMLGDTPGAVAAHGAGGDLVAVPHTGGAPAAVAAPPAGFAPSQPAPPVRRADEPSKQKRRRNYDTSALSADQVEAFMTEDIAVRPQVIDTAAMPQAECGGWVFKELGKSKRKSGDRWRGSGGATGATDLPSSQQPRVRRRYGYVMPTAQRSSQLRYHQYCRLIPTEIGGVGESVVEDPQVTLYHVLPPTAPLDPEPSNTASSDRRLRTTTIEGTLHVVEGATEPASTDSRGLSSRDPLLCLSASGRATGQTTEFVRFKESGRELGGIYHSDHGVQLRSAAGDFAEWHPALDQSELPYEEGSVVGLFKGKLSLRTADADMVAVVSRRALCVGSFPGTDKAVEGDVIAYLGQVPVRVRGNVASGDTLVPSMRHDGTAIAWQDGTDASKHDDVLAAVGIAMSEYVAGAETGDPHGATIGLVDALITPPSSQQRRQQQQKQPQKVVDPALDYVSFRSRSVRARRGFLMRTCVAVVVGAVVLCVAVVTGAVGGMSGPGDPARLHGGPERPRPHTTDQDPCYGMACEPGNCTIANESTQAGLSLYTDTAIRLPADGATRARCICPEGFSSKVTFGDNDTMVLSCEANTCLNARSNLIDPVMSHTVQWARDTSVSRNPVPSSCGTMHTFERCHYDCDPGYVPTGDALCLPNGTMIGGGCVPIQCKPLAIPHSDHDQGNECTGFTGDGCNFTCAKGYRRGFAQSTSATTPPAEMPSLLCIPPTQEFVSDFAFTVSGAVDSTYNGVYVMSNRTCHGRAVWQREQTLPLHDAPVLYAERWDESSTTWFLGPAARAVDCRTTAGQSYAGNMRTTCSEVPSPAFPDNVACNPPVTAWQEFTHSCEGLGDDCSCPGSNSGLPEGICVLNPSKLRVGRAAVGIGGVDDQQQLCVPL